MLSLEIVEITPQQAASWLSLNIDNRIPRQRVVNSYARDMAAGKWEVTGDPIKFNGTRLVDGQHRLQACVQAGVPFTSAVARNVAETAHAAIDNGVKRTTADELRWLGVGDPATISSILGLLWRWDHDVLNDPSQLATKSELVDMFLGNQDEILLSANMARRIWDATRIPTSCLGALYLRLCESWDSEVANEWFDHLASGTDYVHGDPALVLRNYALRVQSIRAIRPRQTDWLAVLIKATNAHLAGQLVRQIRWRAVGPAAERFPELLTKEDVA